MAPGMPLEVTYEAVGALDEDGEVRYYTVAAADLKTAERLGMARHVVVKLEHPLARETDEGEGE